MEGKKDSKKSDIEMDLAIKEEISKGLSSGIKKAENTPYTLTDEATSDFKILYNDILDKEGFEIASLKHAAWCNVFLFLSKHPSYGKDASHYAHGLRKHFIGGMNKRIYYIEGQNREIIIVRILHAPVPEHVQKEIDKHKPR
jgi:plasmid stabilization system protein ParE